MGQGPSVDRARVGRGDPVGNGPVLGLKLTLRDLADAMEKSLRSPVCAPIPREMAKALKKEIQLLKQAIGALPNDAAEPGADQRRRLMDRFSSFQAMVAGMSVHPQLAPGAKAAVRGFEDFAQQLIDEMDRDLTLRDAFRNVAAQADVDALPPARGDGPRAEHIPAHIRLTRTPVGYFVTDLNPESPFAAAGVRVGDMIHSIGTRSLFHERGERPVRDVFRQAVQEGAPRVRIGFDRDGETLLVAHVQLLPGGLIVDPTDDELQNVQAAQQAGASLAIAREAKLRESQAARAAKAEPQRPLGIVLSREVRGYVASGFQPHSAAEAAGLRAGDVIHSVNGHVLAGAGDLQAVREIVQDAMEPGAPSALITYSRDGQRLQAEVALSPAANLPQVPAARQAQAQPAPLGISATHEARGYVIDGFRPYSQAEAAGLRVGDVIHSLSGCVVAAHGTLSAALQSVEPGAAFALVVYSRDGERGEAKVPLSWAAQSLAA